MIEKIVDKLVEKKWMWLTALLIITLGLSINLKNIGIDNSLEGWFLKNDPTLTNYKAFQDLYGNDEVISVLMVPPQNSSVFEKSFVKTVHEISNTLESHQLVRKVISITSSPYMDGSDGELVIEDMLTPALLEQTDNTLLSETLEKRILSQPLWEKLLFDKEKKGVMFFIEPSSLTSEEMDKVRPKLLSFVKSSFKGHTFYMAGMGVTYEELNRISMNDSVLFTALAYIILIFVTFLFFRNRAILIASTGSILITVLLFMGLFVLCGKRLNMMSAVLPTLIIIISLADNVHIFLHYEKTSIGKDRLKRNLNYVLLPCLFTSVTTAIGFSSLYSSPIVILKDFGIFAAIGVICAFGVSVILCTTVLSYYENKAIGLLEDKKPDLTDRFIERLTLFVTGHYKTISVVGISLILIGGFGITKLVIDTYSINFLLDKNQVKKESLLIEQRYGYYLPLEIRMIPKSDDGVKDPSFLKKISHLEKLFEGMPGFEGPMSLSDVVKQLNRVLTDNDEASYKIPDTKEAVAQELLLYEMDENNDLGYFTDSDFTEIRFTVKVPMVSGKSIKALMERADEAVFSVFQGSVDVIYGGYIPLYVKLLEYITDSQIQSFLIAFLFIFAVMGILFRSLRVIIIGILPNIVPIFITLGVMGFTGINLDIATVTIAVIVIGIAVDDTIHFIFSYMRCRNRGDSVEVAIAHTLSTSGKAIIITSVMLITGYSVLLLASIKSVIFFGLLISIAMLSAVLCDLLLLPSMLILFSKKTV